jgi:hypothetical protein
MMPDEGFEVAEAALKPLPDVTADREVYLFQPPEYRLQGYAKS